MPTKSKRPPLFATEEERESLSKTARSRKEPHRKVQRARILEQYLAGGSFAGIALSLKTQRRTVYQTVDRALAMGAVRAEFEEKMKEVLLVYKEAALAAPEGLNDEGGKRLCTVSVDEKPGIRALASTAPDLPPMAGKHATHGRDCECRRLGAASVLAALDLHDGHIIARAEQRHRSREFIMLL